MERMTLREIDVLRILLAGATNKEIGRRLQISEATVENHLHRIYAKLGVRNRTEAALKAVQSGLNRPDLRPLSEQAFDMTARAW
jgi:DNA-binding CsgD family transcriptional regulator